MAMSQPALPISEYEIALDYDGLMGLSASREGTGRSDSHETPVGSAGRASYIAALQKDATDVPAWMGLALSMTSSETLHLSDTLGDVTRTSCLVRVLQLSSDHAEAWAAIGACILYGCSGTNSGQIVINGISVSARRAFTNALLTNPDLCVAWVGLASTLRPTELVLIDGMPEPISRRKCLARVLECEPSNAVALCNLGILLGPRELFSLPSQNVTLSRRDCFLRALTVNPQCAVAWLNLGNDLGRDECIFVGVAGTAVTRRDCFLRSLCIDAKRSSAWCGLGTTIVGPKETVFVKSISAAVSEQQCYLAAVRINSKVATFWNNLGCTIGSRGKLEVTDSSGNTAAFTARDCFVKAVELDAKHADAWKNVSRTLGVFEKVLIPGISQRVGRAECMRRVEACSPSQ